MEKKIGEPFTEDNKIIKAIAGEGCEGCIYKGATKPSCRKDNEKIGPCYEELREDLKSVIFIRLS